MVMTVTPLSQRFRDRATQPWHGHEERRHLRVRRPTVGSADRLATGSTRNRSCAPSTWPGGVAAWEDSTASGIGDRLAAVIARALATDAADGFASADDLVLALEGARAAARAAPLAPGQRHERPERPEEAAGRPAEALARSECGRAAIRETAAAADPRRRGGRGARVGSYCGACYLWRAAPDARNGGHAKSSTTPARAAPGQPPQQSFADT